MEGTFTLNTYEIFFIFFITLGPVKIILPFFQLTEHLSVKDRIKVALHAELISAIIILILAVFGVKLIEKWGFSRIAISITGGIILFIQGLALVKLNPAQINFVKMMNIQNKDELSLKQITYYLIAPVIITPAGVTAILATRSLHYADYRNVQMLTIKISLLILVLNLAVMLSTPLLCKIFKPTFHQILGWIFSIFLMILGVHTIINTLSNLKIIMP